MNDDFKQDIPISSIDKTKKTITVDLKTDVDNDIVSAHSPDEFLYVLIKLEIY